MGTHDRAVPRHPLRPFIHGNVARVKRLAALLIPAALVLAACGGDDDTAATTTAVAGAGVTTADDSDPDAPAGTDPAPAQPGEGSSSAYCNLFREFDEEDPFENLDDDDFGGFREGFEQMQDLLEEIQAIAPAEIRDDFATIAGGFGQLRDALEAVDYNFFALDESALEGFEDIRFEEAGNRIDEYNERVCGISRDDFDDDFDVGDDFDFGGEFDDDSIRDLIAQQLAMLGLTEAQATCVVDKLDLESLEGDDADPMAFFQFFQECGVDLATLGQG
jgi:hypothetical protein